MHRQPTASRTTLVLDVITKTDEICGETGFVKTKSEVDARLPDPKLLTHEEWRGSFAASDLLGRHYRDSPALLHEVNKIWRDGYARTGNYLLVRDIAEIKRLDSLFAALGLNREDWAARVDAKMLGDPWCGHACAENKRTQDHCHRLGTPSLS